MAHGPAPELVAPRGPRSMTSPKLVASGPMPAACRRRFIYRALVAGWVHMQMRPLSANPRSRVAAKPRVSLGGSARSLWDVDVGRSEAGSAGVLPNHGCARLGFGRFSCAGFGREAEFGRPDAIRRVGPGPPKSGLADEFGARRGQWRPTPSQERPRSAENAVAPTSCR